MIFYYTGNDCGQYVFYKKETFVRKAIDHYSHAKANNSTSAASQGEEDSIWSYFNPKNWVKVGIEQVSDGYRDSYFKNICRNSTTIDSKNFDSGICLRFNALGCNDEDKLRKFTTLVDECEKFSYAQFTRNNKKFYCREASFLN